MKNKFLIILFVIIILISIAIYFYTSNKNNNSNYDVTKTSSNNSTISDSDTNNNTNFNVEEEISSFSTKIYSTGPARQNNISITCNLLNNAIVKNGETFSFCDIIGKATIEKGYQEADIFDKEGNKIKGLGGRKLSN